MTLEFLLIKIKVLSIGAMSSILKQNIYNLDFGFKPKGYESPRPDPLAPVRCYCVFWADHLLNGESAENKGELTSHGAVFEFMKERFLRWLESLSLLPRKTLGRGSIDEKASICCPGMFMTVAAIFNANRSYESRVSSRLAGFLEVAEKFIRSHGSI